MGIPQFYGHLAISPLFRLIEQVRDGEILLPRFSRPFVWEDEKRLDLLDSVRRGLPIGSLLVWRTEQHALACHTNVGGWHVAERRPHGPWTYLIDGHQRMITFLSALTRPDPKLREQEDENSRSWAPICYDLEEETFKATTKRLRIPETWMPLHVLMSSLTMYEFCKPLYASGRELEARRAEALRNRFLDYSIPVVPMLTEDFGLVVTSFQRINRSGTPVTELQMLETITAGRGLDLLERLTAAKEKHFPLLKGFRDIEVDSILDVVKLSCGLALHEQDPEKLADVLVNRIEEVDLAARRLAGASKLLGELCGVSELSRLPYKYQLVLATMIFSSDPSERMHVLRERRKRIAEWFWRTSFLELLAGISEGRLRQVTSELRSMLDVTAPYAWPKWLSGEVEGPPNPRRDSSRVRALRALLTLHGKSDDLIEQYRLHPDDPPAELVDLERAQVEAVGLEYALVKRGARPRTKPAPAPRPRRLRKGIKLT